MVRTAPWEKFRLQKYKEVTEYLFHIKIWIFILSSKVNVFHILKTFTLKMPKNG